MPDPTPIQEGNSMSVARIEQKTSFSFIRYASVWEDADILCEALAPSCHNGRILSIASAGDNVLALLTLDPKEIIAADLNPTQLACVELRLSAFRHLNHTNLLAFLGVTPSATRLKIYQQFRNDLSPAARNFWDQRSHDIETGAIHVGKFEHYLKIFGQKILPWIHSQKIRDELFTPRAQHERLDFYEKHWNTFFWRLLFKVFFSRTLMGRLGRDPAFFDHVEGSVSERILDRTKHALTDLPTESNPYLTYIIKGNFTQKALPRYLRNEFKDMITSRLDRIKLICAPIHQVDQGLFDGFNLSDIFEYMDQTEFENCYSSLIAQANPHARLAYWNMLVPRGMPKKEQAQAKPLENFAKALHQNDKAWFYQAFHVDEII